MSVKGVFSAEKGTFLRKITFLPPYFAIGITFFYGIPASNVHFSMDSMITFPRNVRFSIREIRNFVRKSEVDFGFSVDLALDYPAIWHLSADSPKS